MFGIFGGANQFDGVTSDSGTHGRLDSVNSELDAITASLGTDGLAPEVIPGTGVRGWLRSIYDTLLDTLTTVDFNGDEAHTDAAEVLAALSTIDAHTAANSSITISRITAPVTVANTVTVTGAVTINNAVLAVTMQGAATSAKQDVLTNALVSGAQTTMLYDPASGNPMGIAANAMTVTVTNPSTATSDATAANQALEIAKLASIANLITGGTERSIPVNVANVPLFTAANAATIAGSVTINNASLGVSVSNFPATQPVSVAGALTVQVTNGTQIADTRAGDAGQNQLIIGESRKEVTFTNGGLAAIDVTGYLWASVNVVRTSGTLTTNLNNDNSTTLAAPYISSNSVSSFPSVGAIATTGIFYLPLTGRYFSLVSAAFVGTVTIELHSSPPPAMLVTGVEQIGTWTVAQGAGSTSGQPWRVCGVAPQTTLNSVTVTGSGTAIDVLAADNATMAVHLSGTVSTISITLQGSMDNANWFALVTSTTVTDNIMQAPAGSSWRFYRGNITTLTGAGATVLAIICCGV